VKAAIAVITIGDASRDLWLSTFMPSVRLYADRCGYDLHHFTSLIDHETTRHPSWQKLLLAGHSDLAGYDRIVYLDHDILISPLAPPIAECVSGPRIGAVTWAGSYNDDPIARSVIETTWRWNNAKWLRDLNPQCFADLLVAAGYPPTEDHCNTGVFVFSPQHAEVFREVYEHGLSNERTSLEQAALTNCLCNTHKHLVHALDRRFNAIWDFEKIAYYSFLDQLYPTSTIIMHCIEATLARVWFLHFAGGGMQREWARNYVSQSHLRSNA